MILAFRHGVSLLEGDGRATRPLYVPETHSLGRLARQATGTHSGRFPGRILRSLPGLFRSRSVTPAALERSGAGGVAICQACSRTCPLLVARVHQAVVDGLGERLDGGVRPGLRRRGAAARGFQAEPRAAPASRSSPRCPGRAGRLRYSMGGRLGLAEGQPGRARRGALRGGQQPHQHRHRLGRHAAGTGREPDRGGAGGRRPRCAPGPPPAAPASRSRPALPLRERAPGGQRHGRQVQGRAGRAGCPCGRPRCACSRPARPGAPRAGTCARGR